MNEIALDWQALVEEAVRRRKAEGLSQAELAGLAGVNRQTVIALERGDGSLRLSSVFAVLGVLGLAVNTEPLDREAAFVRAARQRWHELTDPLPEGAAARQPHGAVEYAYALRGELETIDPAQLAWIAQTAIDRLTGWPPFLVPTKPSLRPRPHAGELECWIGNPEADGLFVDAAHSDYWRLAPDALAYLRRGFQEDSADHLAPGTIFDLTLPIWRAGEVLAHAARLAQVIDEPNARIHLVVRYSGLLGRELRSWANPLGGHLTSGYRARANDATAEVGTSPAEVADDLPAIVHRLLAPLYLRFDGYRLERDLVDRETAQLLANRGRFSQLP